MKLYIFGNGNISFQQYLDHYCEILNKISFSDIDVLVCDFRGTDTLTMEYLKNVSSRVTVYHIGEKPRYFPDRYRTKVSSWNWIGGFCSDEERDTKAIADCTHFLAVDFNSNQKRQSGTSKNIEQCLNLNKNRLII